VDALLVVISLFVIRFVIPFGIVLLIGSLVKRSRLAMR
jgi:hypothetical protein